MLPLIKLHQAVSQAEENGLFDQLKKVYEQVPETECQRCASCCTVPQPAYIVEYLNMFRYVNKNMPEKWPEILAAAVRYYFLELVDINQRCPFLNEQNDCIVYEVRPFTCRIFGLMGKQKSNEQALNNMRRLAENYRNEHGIVLPKEIIEYQMPECDQVRVKDGQNKKPAELINLLSTDIGQLETLFVPMDVVESQYTFVPYVNHLVLSVVSEGARIRRPKIMKEFLENRTSELLQNYVEKYTRTSF